MSLLLFIKPLDERRNPLGSVSSLFSSCGEFSAVKSFFLFGRTPAQKEVLVIT
nr:MAG TPA: hypothetical protein [Caudoviricetes sp.]